MTTRPITRAHSVELQTMFYTSAQGKTEQRNTYVVRKERNPVSSCKHMTLHLHSEEGMIHNVPLFCSLTKRALKESFVYCKNIHEVFEQDGLTQHFTTKYIESISSTNFTESGVRMPCLKQRGRESTPVLYNHLVFFSLEHTEGDLVNHF